MKRTIKQNIISVLWFFYDNYRSFIYIIPHIQKKNIYGLQAIFKYIFYLALFWFMLEFEIGLKFNTGLLC